LRRSVAGQGVDETPVDREVLETGVLIAPVAGIEDRSLVQVASLASEFGAQAYELMRVRVGERAQQHRIHQAEDGGVRADAQGQRHEHDSREAGRPSAGTQREPEIGQ
jgi:hypothetical protein